MARQAILAGISGPVYINETATRQAILAGPVYINETVAAATSAAVPLRMLMGTGLALAICVLAAQFL